MDPSKKNSAGCRNRTLMNNPHKQECTKKRCRCRYGRRLFSCCPQLFPRHSSHARQLMTAMPSAKISACPSTRCSTHKRYKLTPTPYTNQHKQNSRTPSQNHFIVFSLPSIIPYRKMLAFIFIKGIGFLAHTFCNLSYSSFHIGFIIPLFP